MNIFVIGSGGREHAICHAFSQSTQVSKIFCAPGNAGIAAIAECVPINADDIETLADFAASNAIDLTFVGGEVPLALGIVDLFEKRGLQIIGATKDAAQLESSKAFAKDFMARHGVPTAKYVLSHSADFAVLELESGDFGDAGKPVAVKADGLAAGKGVVVAANRADAITAIREMADLVGADAASKFVIEECLEGREVSLLMFADGEDFVLMPPTRDHKRIGEGDSGPNTGGMGTFTDDSLLKEEELQTIVETMIEPTLRGCVREGFRFRGILFLGLMITAKGPKLLEYNVRFGDPEAQSILIRLESDLHDICEAMLAGNLSGVDVKWKPGNSATIVLASEGYPSEPRTGDVINGLDNAAKIDSVEIFHAGTAVNEGGDITTAGGRVLGITSVASSLEDALGASYKAAAEISWEGMQYRTDIGK